jgi:hypothetical protein
MATSSPSQTKPSRSKNGKTNGTSGRMAGAEEAIAASPSSLASASPSTEDIARRAYEIYEREGRQPGTELQNWLRAEAELGLSKSH